MSALFPCSCNLNYLEDQSCTRPFHTIPLEFTIQTRLLQTNICDTVGSTVSRLSLTELPTSCYSSQPQYKIPGFAKLSKVITPKFNLQLTKTSTLKFQALCSTLYWCRCNILEAHNKTSQCVCPYIPALRLQSHMDWLVTESRSIAGQHWGLNLCLQIKLPFSKTEITGICQAQQHQ